MRKQIGIGLLFLLCLAVGCATLQVAERSPKATPVITKSFASEQVRLGETWRIYLNASDPNGEMIKIYGIVEQPGQIYPVSITKVSKENAKEFSGYIYLSTAPPARPLDGTSFSLTVQVQDRSGSFSQPAVFPLTIKNFATQEAPPQGIFKEQDLGPVMITVMSLIGSPK